MLTDPEDGVGCPDREDAQPGSYRHLPEALWPQTRHHLYQEPSRGHQTALEETAAEDRREGSAV